MSVHPTSAFIGCGRLAQALAPALAEAGWPVVAVASRDRPQAVTLAAALPGCQALSAEAAAAAADWVWLSVPDAALARQAQALAWRPGQVVLHAAGATGLDVLSSAEQAGARAAGFHPLQLFPGGRVSLQGCGVGVEARDTPVLERLVALGQALGMQPLTLTPSTRLLYHAGANLAASGVVAVLAQAQAAWAAAGLPADQAQALLSPLTQGALAAALSVGLGQAVAGPVARGDVDVLSRQLDRLADGDPDLALLYRLLARKQLALVTAQGRLSAELLGPLQALLAASGP